MAALLALRGREAEATLLIDVSRDQVTQRGDGIGISWLDWAEAVLYNGLGRYQQALTALRFSEHAPDPTASNWHLAELVEAAVRAGAPELAAGARRRLAEMSRVSGTDWPSGSRPARKRCWPKLTHLRSCTSRRSIDWADAESPSISPALTSSAASG